MQRRELIAGLGLATLAAHQVARAQTRRDTLVMIFLRGGADGLAMLPPHADDGYYSLRPTLAVPRPGTANGAIDLNGEYGLHPALAPLKPVYDAGELAFIPAAGMPGVSRSHFQVQDILERGTMDGSVSSGWLGRHLASITDNGSPLRAVNMDAGMPRSLLGDPFAAALPRLDLYQWLKQFPGSYFDVLEGLQQVPGSDFNDGTANAALTLTETLDSIRPWQMPVSANYPNSTTGTALRQVAQLIKADCGTEVAHININSWDTHGYQLEILPKLLADLATSLAAFRSDLGSLYQQTTVIVMTEFGRRVAENASKGTDHGKGSCMLAMGAGVNGGIHGQWPALTATTLDDGDIPVVTDYRQVLGDFLMARRNVTNLGPIFPGFAAAASSGVFV